MRHGDKDLVALIIEAGADPTKLREDGGTLLHVAVQENRLDAIEVLLRAGTDIAVKNKVGSQSTIVLP